MTYLMKSCERCAALFRPKPSHYARRRFCSMPCRARAVGQSTASLRGDMQRDRGAGVGYRKRGGRHEHRAVAEQMLGRALRPGEIVHHIDGDRRNNAPANLRVMTQAEHMREHGLGIAGAALPWKPWEYRR